ncbi:MULTISPECIES: aromatic-ring-hydroxylating dioxygenase subunit beta [Peribacillus]|uniref:Aromatic-ring-hydroxylating dioxygenase subunit beta n=1 Tax=Peribacillus castrilensis TaxID=2897690 RepID=A0AAW9NLF5_9BACI|nr:aromatic-ring-hydroxylating dioxygenase subunit beta [Peribacillus frigoritolerans]MEC0276017.1 aromatic-ring-hydroxylating dioxygenase subunit beta [Peribacillus castrilensis]MEC0300126.1 aromatic-ring-hydroxylating dioxygenase subunit beta [Peribacillus castrilensis]MEC0345144.1 aromatic-ring-hydroxylating dioxygenase subunit beta [Peribacillus castrilensis]TFH62506.1 3-phenylpropionate/cinnamic acid dioxygenase subunit beta [Peribacillus frigoritolerans]
MNVEKMLIKCQFEQWLYDEAQLLDDIEFDDWFDLMHSSLRYQMPVRVNKEGVERPDYSTDMFTFNDDIELLKLRVDRLKTDYAWAEIPPSRTRRFVSNVRVKDYVEGEKAVVKSYLLIYRSRSTDIQHDLISGERNDEFIFEEGKWKLSKRIFIVDQTTINTRNLAIFV